MKTQPAPAGAANPERFRQAIRLIDEAHAADPRSMFINEEDVPYELGYAIRLTDWVLRREPDASERILLAARAQHLKRWTLPRDEFPAGLHGYLAWRETLKTFHADEAGKLLRQAGYAGEEIESVQQLIRKERFPMDPDTRVVEDGLCLVFMDLQLAAFKAGHAEEKVIDIIQKTWGKMSDVGQAMARDVEWDAVTQQLIDKALSSSGA